MSLLLSLVACNTAPPTWHADVAPVIVDRCAGCHTEGTIAPFSLDDYESVAPVAELVVDAVEGGRMPPWAAQDTEECSPRLPWKHDLRVTDDELDMLKAWIEAGTPEGDPDDAAELPAPPSLVIEDPSVVMTFEEPFTVEGDGDVFQCFVLDPGNTEDVWVTAVQLDADNTLVDHHGLIIADIAGSTAPIADGGTFPCFTFPDELEEGYLMATWTPGAVPMSPPETAAMYLPAGSRVVVQMHYHPADQPEVDQSSVSLKWTTEAPEWAAMQALVGNYSRLRDDGTGLQPGPNDSGDEPEFVIPAGVTDHVETLLYTQAIDIDFPLYSVATHMHYVGTDMKIDLVRANPVGDEPKEECLIQTPNWDFGWQRAYDYDAPIEDLPVVGLGDSLRMRCTYDNSLGNPFVASALDEQGLSEPHDVVLGDETLDEMCLGLFGILVPPGLMGTMF